MKWTDMVVRVALIVLVAWCAYLTVDYAKGRNDTQLSIERQVKRATEQIRERNSEVGLMAENTRVKVDILLEKVSALERVR